MSTSIDDRRGARWAARCPVRVGFGAGGWHGETEDLGAEGCRIVSLLRLRRGEGLRLRLRFAGVPFPLEVTGTVAWSSADPPWRTGIAFARGQEKAATRFVRAVLLAAPGLARIAATPGAGRSRRLAAAAPPTRRQAQAHALLVVAQGELAAGRTIAARDWLRAAARMAPDDPAIAAALAAVNRPGKDRP